VSAPGDAPVSRGPSAFLAKGLAVLILFGCFAGWITAIGAVVELSKLHEARTWPARKALLTHSYARYMRSRGRWLYWHAELAGNFLDSGERFGIRRVRYGIGNGPWTRRQVEQVVAKYPANTEVTVYQSPRNPRQVILEPDAPATGSWIALASGLALGLLPGVLYLYGVLVRKRAEATREGAAR
jgi:hypothetical protein